MRKNRYKILIAIVFIGGAATLLEFFYLRTDSDKSAKKSQIIETDIAQSESADLAGSNELQNEIENKPEEPNPTTLPDPPEPRPEKFLLQMSFYSQAPLGNWDAIHEDMCEEASLLNAGLYLQNRELTLAKYEEELQKMKKMEEKKFGEWKSSPISDIKKLSDEYFGGEVKSKMIDDPTIEEIEAEIAAGNPIIVPLAGRQIGNPNFTPPGPVYHMLVIKGYDSQNFITNDVGTRKGASYTYKKAVIMKNTHDWNEKDINLGAKRVLVLYK